MRLFQRVVCCLVAWAATQAMAWSSHTLASYRAFEKMPEVANAAAVPVETLESFLRAEENTLEALLASQEAWARANLDRYPARPAALAFTADPTRSDEARRSAFLMALRVAPNSRFALYAQVDPWQGAPLGPALPWNAVSTTPDRGNAPVHFVALRAGDNAVPLTILATAADEPDYGLDQHLWEDSPSDWGRQYGFGPAPSPGPWCISSEQGPFHSGFLHESRVLYLVMPQVRRTYSLLRSHQFSTLSALAFRTGHAYWGWRFAGLSLHYLQELTQPFQASLAPGEPTTKLLAAHAMAAAGMRAMRDEMATLATNRKWVLKKLQYEWLERNASNRQEGPIEKALRAADKDKNYPEWNDRYLRDVVSLQTSRSAAGLVQVLLATVPGNLVSDPEIDLAGKESGLSVLAEMSKQAPSDRARLENAVAELMGNLGAHSRNALRGILKASSPP